MKRRRWSWVTLTTKNHLFAFRVRRSRDEMFIGHGRLCVSVSVCLSVPRRIPTLRNGPGCNLRKWKRVPSSGALFGGFAIGARVSLIWQHSTEREMSASSCTRSMPGLNFGSSFMSLEPTALEYRYSNVISELTINKYYPMDKTP